MAASTKKWDDTKLAHLLLSINDAVEIPFTKENKDTIVATMNQKYGYDVNWNGIRQHLQKLKKKDGEAPSAPKKPPKTKKPTKRKQVPDEDEDEEKVVKKKLKLEVDTFDKYIDDEPDLDEDGEI